MAAYKECVQQSLIYESPGFPCAPLCPLWLMPLTHYLLDSAEIPQGRIKNRITGLTG